MKVFYKNFLIFLKINQENEKGKKISTVNYEKQIQNFKKSIVESMQIIKNLETYLFSLNEKKQKLLVKKQIKSENQLILESFYQREENYRRVLLEREETIAMNEKAINDLRNKLQVKIKKIPLIYGIFYA